MCCVIAAVRPTLLQLKAAFLKSSELREGSVVSSLVSAPKGSDDALVF